MQLGHEGHHVISHHLLATFLRRPSGMKAIGVVGKVLAAPARQSRKATREGGRKIPEVLSELSYRPSQERSLLGPGSGRPAVGSESGPAAGSEAMHETG